MYKFLVAPKVDIERESKEINESQQITLYSLLTLLLTDVRCLIIKLFRSEATL